MTNRWKIVFILLLLFNAFLWLAYFSRPDQAVHLIACDVGQGDALLITQGQTQVLIDGGPNNRILDCLSRHLPFWDRRLELVILTHPESDHYQGLIEVLRRYQVNYFLASSLENPAQSYQAFKEVVGESAPKILDPALHSRFKLGGLSLSVLWPTAAFLAENLDPVIASPAKQSSSVLGTATSSLSPNDFSIVTLLSYSDFTALFTGDIGPSVIDDFLAVNQLSPVNYLKVPHHGSKNGLTPELLKIASPQYAIISVGKNPWGHPHQEVLDLLNNANAQILRTDQLGDIELITNGHQSWLE